MNNKNANCEGCGSRMQPKWVACPWCGRGSSPAMGAYAPPNSIEAEQSTLGAMLISRSAIDIAREQVDQADFYRETHQTLFDVVTVLHDRGDPVDLITVQEELRNREKLDWIGGISYLTSLFETTPTAANVEYYAKIVQEKAILRRLITAALEIIGLCQGEFDDINDIIVQSEEAIAQTVKNFGGDADDEGFDDILRQAFDEIDEAIESGGKRCGQYIGLPRFDDVTGGLRGGDLVVVSGETSMGKTSFAMQAAEHVAIDDDDPKTVLVIEPEMSKKELVLRQLSSRSRVQTLNIERGKLSQDQVDAVYTAAGRLAVPNLRVIVSTGKVSEIALLARRIQRTRGLGMIVVDGLTLLQPSKPQSIRELEVSNIAYGLKALAVLLNIPIVAVCQLNEGNKTRQNKRPQLRDLRESRAIAHAADKVIFLYSETYFQESEADGDDYIDSSDNLEAMEVILAKHRNGPRKRIKMLFDRPFRRFIDRDPALLEDGSTAI